jgi:hypothetical protein
MKYSLIISPYRAIESFLGVLVSLRPAERHNEIHFDEPKILEDRIPDLEVVGLGRVEGAQLDWTA